MIISHCITYLAQASQDARLPCTKEISPTLSDAYSCDEISSVIAVGVKVLVVLLAVILLMAKITTLAPSRF